MAKKTRRGAEQPSSRLPLNRDRILAAAVEIADERGVGAVTMREVASRLGVEAMSLYNHVANKDDILDGMVDLVVEQFDLPAGRRPLARGDAPPSGLRSRGLRPPSLGAAAPRLARVERSVETALLRLGARHADDGRLLDGRRGARVLAARQLHLRLRHPAVQLLGRRRCLTRGDGRGDPGVHPRRAVPVPASDGVACDAGQATTPRPTSTSGSRSSSTGWSGSSTSRDRTSSASICRPSRPSNGQAPDLAARTNPVGRLSTRGS